MPTTIYMGKHFFSFLQHGTPSSISTPGFRPPHSPNHNTPLKQHLLKMSTTTHSHSDLQFILNVRVTLKASDVDTWLPVFKTVREKVLAEPECKFFYLGRLVNIDPLTQQPGPIPEGEVAISWSEGFTASLEWLGEVQIKKPYYKEYFETVVPLETSSEFWGRYWAKRFGGD